MHAVARNGARQVRAAWIRRIRQHRHLTQPQLAQKVGVTTNQISRYERALDDPRLEILDRLLVALECWYVDLLEDTDAPPPPHRPMRRPVNDVAARSIDIVIGEFAHPSRPSRDYPDLMRCWICHGRPGECTCYFICKVCGLPVVHGSKCSGLLHGSSRAVPLEKAC